MTSTTTTINQQLSNIVETTKSRDEFKMFTQVVEAAGLIDTLKLQGPYTVFAPTDEAFKNLPTGTVEGWMKDLPKLKSILNYHIVDRKITSSEVQSMTMDGKTPSVTTLQGSPIELKTNLTAQKWMNSKKSVYVNDAKVVRPEMEASNGVIHVIDRVLIPAS